MRKDCQSCYNLVREWKCAECAPNSNSFHVGQHSQIRFCEDYCHAVFYFCSDIPFDMGHNENERVFYLNDGFTSAEEWCRGKTAKEPNCFKGNIPKEKDSNCICPDHKCHLGINELELWDDENLEL